MQKFIYFSKKYSAFHNIELRYNIIRAGITAKNNKKLFICMDQNGHIVTQNIPLNKLSFSTGFSKSFMTLKLSEKKRYLLAGSSLRKMIVFNVHSMRKIKTFKQENYITNLVLNQSHSRSISICHGGSILLINLNNLQIIHYEPKLASSLWVGATLAHDFENNSIIGRSQRSHSIYRHLKRKRVRVIFNKNKDAHNFLFLRKTRVIVVGYEKGALLIDQRTFKEILDYPVDSRIESGLIITLTSNGAENILLMGFNSGHILLLNVKTRALHAMLKQSDEIFFMHLCSDESFMVSCGVNKSPLKVWNVPELLRTCRGSFDVSIE